MLSTVILLIFYERFHEKKKKNRIEASFYATLFPSIAYNRLDRWGGGEGGNVTLLGFVAAARF